MSLANGTVTLRSWCGELTPFRSAELALHLADGVTCAHEHLPESALLPGWEYEDAGQVVLVPAQFLLAEETDNVAVALVLAGVLEEVVLERVNVVAD